jgi:Mg-chelatase subunit ChlD
MKFIQKIACGLFAGATLFAIPAFADKEAKPPKAETKITRPRVDVVFVLDTTGSMGGLIDGAKAKIWSISNEILRGTPTPEVRVGLVAYRDKGDDYVTQLTDLTTDLDSVYDKLMGFQAGGGGDTPEHVNQGLKDAIDKMAWSKDKDSLKIIFLVGDAPPHEDYNDKFDHLSLAKKAIERGIIINTIRCGSDPDTGRVWKEIAERSDGSFVTIEQSGGVAVISSPYDEEIAKLGAKLDSTVVSYGEASARKKAEDARESASGAVSAAPAAAADRATAKSSSYTSYAADLISEIEAGRVKLEDVKEESLPAEMKTMSAAERKSHVEAKLKERAELRKEIKALDQKRAEYLKKEAAKGAEADSFDSAVEKAIHEQAKKKGISYKESK